MTLRRQLMLVSLLLLALPWAGCQFVREVETALQSGQSRALLATSRAIATVVAGQPALLYPDLARLTEMDISGQLYATRSDSPIIVDGYADGWESPAHGQFGPVAYRARVRGDRLFLLFTVTDANVVYQDPRQSGRATGDRLILAGANGRYVIATAAPGAVQARLGERGALRGFEPRIRGYWQDSLEGYSIELSLPLALLGQRLGFQVVDVTDDATAPATRYGNLDDTQRKPPPWLVYPSAALSRQLQAFSRAETTLQVVDRQGWLAATTGEQGRPADNADTPWLLRALYRAVLSNAGKTPLPGSGQVGRPALPMLDETLATGVPASAWYSMPDYEQRKLLVAAAPVVWDGKVLGAVLAQQSSELYLSLTDRAFSQLLYWSLLAILLSALGLLGYASWLSWRIRRLSRASRDVIRPDGSLAQSFPASQAGDEVGELSRQYAQLIERLRDYTDYLRSLSRKLSHELRTPIAVIQSSLDNIDADREDADIYVSRAREGLSRLSGILTAMSEASRLEESVHANTPERYDLAALLQALASAYRDLHPDIELRLDCEPAALLVNGVPDLVAQMLDKLVDNAASFTPAGGVITLGLAQSGKDAVITVSNDGPLLPASMQQQLFDSMVSIRDSDAGMHLGLGLHIVRLIVEFHRGSARAANREDGSGVVFEVRLPRE